MRYFTLRDFNFINKRVLVRVDFNVPLNNKCNIVDDKRIKAALPTINYLLEHKAQVILMSHLGRPKGKIVNNLRMDPIAKHLSMLLAEEVFKVDDCINIDIPNEKLVLLENLRFHKEEEKNDMKFAKRLANDADLYVNDAFGSCHRSHASVDAITNFLPSCAGFLLENEITNLELKKPKKPYIGILGGAKISDKIELIRSLLKKLDKLLLGGAMIFTFYKSQGIEIGKSLVEDNKLDLAQELLDSYKKKLVLPIDIVIADKIDKKAKIKTVSVDKIPKNMYGVDIGEKSVKQFKNILAKAKTIIWNGPMGIFEIDKFATATNEIAKCVANSKAKTIVGGGDSIAALDKLRLQNKMTHVSTGGGAFLEFIEGKHLPGITALERNHHKFRESLHLF